MVAVQQQVVPNHTTAVGVCPLCFETFPLDQLSKHFAAEQRAIVEYTLQRSHR